MADLRICNCAIEISSLPGVIHRVKNRYFPSGDKEGKRSCRGVLILVPKLIASVQLPSGFLKQTNISPKSVSEVKRLDENSRKLSSGAIKGVQLSTPSAALMLGGSNSGLTYSPLMNSDRYIPKLFNDPRPSA